MRPTHHIGDVAYDVAMRITRRATAARVEAPAKYLGVTVETMFGDAVDARPFEHPSEAGLYTADQMRALLEARSVGAHVRACVERPPVSRGGPIMHEVIVHQRLADIDGKVQWVRVEGGRDATG